MGLSSCRAFSNASSPHGYQSTFRQDDGGCTALSLGETKTRSSKHHSSKVAYAMLPGCVRAAAGRATLPRPGGWCGPPRQRRRRPLPCSSLLAAAQAALLLVKWRDPRVVFGAKKPRVGHSGERSHYGSAAQLHDKV
jgi:hypothetical protein